MASGKFRLSWRTENITDVRFVKRDMALHVVKIYTSTYLEVALDFVGVNVKSPPKRGRSCRRSFDNKKFIIDLKESPPRKNFL